MHKTLKMAALTSHTERQFSLGNTSFVHIVSMLPKLLKDLYERFQEIFSYTSAKNFKYSNE